MADEFRIYEFEATRKVDPREKRDRIERTLFWKGYIDPKGPRQMAWMMRQTTEALELFCKLMDKKRGVF
jgi:hypothetical protein